MIRRLLISVAAASLTAVALPGTPAQAYPLCNDGFFCIYHWWSDADHTNLVGWMHDDTCAGEVTREGTQTRFLEFSKFPCN